MTLAIKKTGKRMCRMWVFALAMVALGCLELTSCGFSDDEEDNPGITYPLELLGGWQGVTRMEVLTDEHGMSTPDQVTETTIEDERIAINPNGTIVGYKLTGSVNWTEASRGFWIYSEDKLLVSDRNGNVVYNVLKLDNSALSISHSVAETGDDGKKYTRTITSGYTRLTAE